MPLASTSLAIVRAIKEGAFGVTPVAGDPFVLRYKSESLNFDISKTASAEINDSRSVGDVTPTSAKTSGGIAMEMRAIGLEPFLEAALQSEFVGHNGTGIGVSTNTYSNSPDTINASSPTGVNGFTSLELGQAFRISSDGVNNGKIVRVHPTTAPTESTLTLDPSTPLLSSSNENIYIQSARLTHGNEQSSFTLEKESSDIGVFIAYRGMTTDKFSLKIASGALTEANFEFMGKDAHEYDATVLPGTPVAADNYGIHSGVSGATNAVWMNGSPVAGTYAKSVDLSYGNGLRSQEAIGELAAVGIGAGSIECTVNMQVYFADKSTFTDFRTNRNQAISFATTDAEGNGYIFTLPRCNITSWKSSAGGKDQDQMVDLTMTAQRDAANPVPALRKVIFIDRVGAAS